MSGLAFFEPFRGGTATPQPSLAGKSLRINDDGTGWEYFTAAAGGAISATSPLIRTGDVLSLAGLSSFGTNTQAILSTGTGWQYVNTTGTGNVVRSASPTFTGTANFENAFIDGGYLKFNGYTGEWRIQNLGGDDSRLMFNHSENEADNTFFTAGNAGAAVGLTVGGRFAAAATAVGGAAFIADVATVGAAGEIGFFGAPTALQQTYVAPGTSIESVITSLQSVIDALDTYGLIAEA